ncbi:undecaprenyldiphospho-muramoylpentapeptide beta-N-acetylglucosaminyltransferase [Parasphingopyxis marina]|uniref:UDP-N-acetylglucosamine--N-acetylmuramyl-(pentapeptide) pyrophosphoryl-undecaprenol N-acetylglucosamine transferase n=1 Tax=Parasphingopyxis marina TaxID=2761622 RepID=A0A842HXD4_9SPHN|nr:undecaprenyldiphospho-muramoylpentapeptide beta-N-acetylglucosaminyltransferase [Parasphingopyxis marina]MBC2776959.1 undecaprenyldiphospho-muramoylpentapeptide beta-N-acetylglucosaminyltransferase [Parasphingopyxis marina]
MRGARHFVLAAGGTGGHIIPAFALATELKKRGHYVALITDERGAAIPGTFEGEEKHILPAGRLTRNPLGWLGAAKNILAGRAMARRLYESFQPEAVIGFGGYPALPALLGALRDGIPTAVHEQNAVLGRVNRLLASKVDAIATAYKQIGRLKESHLPKVHLVGNPVRESVELLRAQPFPALSEDGIFRVLVTGGSQGAGILSEVVPDGLALLPLSFRRRMQVTQQCREEDIERVRTRYADLAIPADLATYIPDLPERLGWSHVVIARAGASTIAELTTAGRPAILVPLPIATDDHQTANAREMAASGGARVIRQAQFTPAELAKQMQKLGLEPDALMNAAGRARSAGYPNATRDLADLVERLGSGLGGEAIPVPATPQARPAAQGAG